jgi:hypothetical protein
MKMKFINESNVDRIIRVVVGIVILALGWGGVVAGGWGLFLKIFGFIPLITGLVGICPLYAVLKIGTKKA